MIAYLQGVLHQVDTDHIVLLTHGVGYQVYLSKPTLESLPLPGSPIELVVHTVVREDSHQLFGFKKAAEKALFLKLIQVNSIGPKLAMTILSGMPARELAEAIGREDLVRLTAIPGIGKKTAERLVVDLKDKILELFSLNFDAGTAEEFSAPASVSEEAVSALTNLGYSRQEAQQALQTVTKGNSLPLEDLVREGLKALS